MLLYRGALAPLALFVVLVQAKPVPMRDVTLKAVIDPSARALAGTVVAAIDMPIGRLSITGHLRARVTCSGTFSGTVSYSRLVRIFAALKRTDLVTQLDGDIVDTLQTTPSQSSFSSADEADSTERASASCTPLSADTVQGRAVVERTELRGALAVAADSVHFAGPAWTVGDSTYHSIVKVRRGDRVIELRINMYERGHGHRP